ncbi:MAG: tyrosine-type recombinase/integrase [Spirochaetes bacterium]|nr:tyrosine-type recombinase/integrase [Spirochaetota bacterium]
MTEKEVNILNEFNKYMSLKGYVPESVYRYISTLKEYFEYLSLINTCYDKVNLKIALDYRGYLVNEKNISRATVNNRLNRIRCFYRFLVLNSHIYKNPFGFVKGLRLGNNIPKNILSVDDMGKLLDNFSIKSDHDLMLKSIAEVMYGSGLRINEVVRLKLDDVDYEKLTITIVQSKSDGKQRKVITNSNALKVLNEYMKYSRGKLLTGSEIEQGFIYPQVKASSFVVSLNRKLKNECERMGLKVITSHGFRHSIATHVFKSGAGIKEVQEFLGHKKITNTEIYTHVLKDELKNVVNKYHPRGE